jgi:PKD repeat protein
MKTRRILFSLALFAVLAAGLTGCLLGGDNPKAEFTTTPQYDYPPLDVSFDARGSTSPNGPIVSYDWDFDDGSTGSGATVTHTFTEKGTYSVTLLVTDSTGKTGARTHQVTALNHAPVAAFTYHPYYVDTHSPMYFDASGSYDDDGEIVDYIWSFGDGTTGEGVTTEHQYTTAGGTGWKPTVQLTVVDEDGDSGRVAHQVMVVGCDSCGG